MSEIIHVTDENFEEVVSQPNVTVLVVSFSRLS